jgi:hypothetical protein
MKTLLEKLAKVKSEIGKISKDSTNPFFKSKYFDVNSLLEHAEPLLQKNGLILLQPILNDTVITEIWEVESGLKVESGIKLPVLNDPQKLGSAITYYRRYTLQSLLGLQAEDDDANKASGNTTETKTDNRPWLDQKGFDYLMTSGTPEQIETAFKTRRMKKEYATQLKTK